MMDISKLESFKLEKGKSYLIVAENLYGTRVKEFMDALVEFFPGVGIMVTNQKITIIEQEVKY